MDCMGKMKDIRNKSYDELCELVEEIKLEDDEFETCMQRRHTSTTLSSPDLLYVLITTLHYSIIP